MNRKTADRVVSRNQKRTIKPKFDVTKQTITNLKPKKPVPPKTRTIEGGID